MVDQNTYGEIFIEFSFSESFIILYLHCQINFTTMKGNNGSELHRLTELKPYDEDLFNRLYKTCKPLIRKLVRGIDARRFNVSPDIINSFFWDKFLYVFNKYQEEYEEERLKATLLSSLQIFKSKLLRNAYTKQAEFNQELTSLEVLFDNNKELLDDTDETILKEEQSVKFHKYMKEHLTQDEYLILQIQLEPPKWFEPRMRDSHGKLSIEHLIDYFELPRDKKSINLLSSMRKNIKRTLEKAGKELR